MMERKIRQSGQIKWIRLNLAMPKILLLCYLQYLATVCHFRMTLEYTSKTIPFVIIVFSQTNENKKTNSMQQYIDILGVISVGMTKVTQIHIKLYPLACLWWFGRLWGGGWWSLMFPKLILQESYFWWEFQTETKFQLQFLTINVISVIVYLFVHCIFIILESWQNIGETTPMVLQQCHKLIFYSTSLNGPPSNMWNH